ncbi:isochorismatase family protein [Planctomonas sp. JC2975]|uniref:isochorismatase family protein n=1 Tax=Planctomonas sp. JC2975 TaxID=2729626 RepID=UPI00147306E2|nr:isochorismatase family protein [Planctomonas sp. JC2975]NNC11314.1 isochorismatase family protein [Planctomonas sp. JC2975]
MTTLEGREATALLVLDVQNGVIGNAYRRDEVVENIRALVDRARAADVPVVWFQHSDEHVPLGSEAWQFVPDLNRDDGERVIPKRYPDAFDETTLESALADLGVGRIVVAGAQSDQCIRATIHGAFTRGYDVTLVGDAHTTEDLSEWGAPPPAVMIGLVNFFWTEHEGPRRTAEVVDTADVDFG